MHKWAIVFEAFNCVQQAPAPEVRRIRNQRTPISVLPNRNVSDTFVQSISVLKTHRTRRRKIALAREIGPLAVLDATCQFRNHKIHVSPALAVRVGSLVDDHAVDRGAQIGAVIEIESAQIKLVCFAFAAVLTHDEPRYGLQQFAGAIHGARF